MRVAPPTQSETGAAGSIVAGLNAGSSSAFAGAIAGSVLAVFCVIIVAVVIFRVCWRKQQPENPHGVTPLGEQSSAPPQAANDVPPVPSDLERIKLELA